MDRELKRLANRAAVIGVGNTAYGSFPDTDEYGLAAQAFRNAIADCGIDKSEIDGLITCRIPYYARMGEVLGIDPHWSVTLPPHGRMSGVGIIESVLAIASGQARTVALLYANIGRSRRVNYGGDEMASVWDPWGFTSPGASHAMMFQSHMARFGTTTRQLAEVSVAIRHHACINPDAVMKKPITIEDHETARPITLPLRLLDYCLINDGAVCIIISSAERARDRRKPPVMISGFGGRDSFTQSQIGNFDPDMWFDAVQIAGAEASEMSGLSTKDVKALMAYDNFSPTVLFSLEGLGFCPRGEVGRFVEGGTLRLEGALPTNTDGGHLSNSYMQGWALNVEAVRQIRGECGARQVTDCDVVQYVQATPCTRSIIYARG
jgi:acetyl-CoA acetyltransferase